jgi:hypothetical protein
VTLLQIDLSKQRMIRKEYNVKVQSVSRFIIALIILFPGLLTLTTKIQRSINNEILNFLFIIIVLAFSLVASYYLSTGKIKIILTEEAIKHIWTRRFILSFSKNFKIPWNMVESYEFHEDRTFDSYFINLNIKRRYRINQINLFPIKDDFKKLIREFPMVANKIRRIENPTNPVLINHAQSLYSTKTFTMIFYLMTGIFGLLLIVAFLNPSSETNWSSFGVIGFGLLFYYSMIKQKTRK